MEQSWELERTYLLRKKEPNFELFFQRAHWSIVRMEQSF